MEYEILKDFVPFKKVPKARIDKYKELLPLELLNIWKELGFGSFMDGYLRVIDPDEYMRLIEGSYIKFPGEICVPVLASAFGDIFLWCYNPESKTSPNSFTIIQYSHGTSCSILPDFGMVLTCLAIDPDFKREYCRFESFSAAKKQLGELSFEECYGFVPLLVQGGPDELQNLCKMNMAEYIELIISIIVEADIQQYCPDQEVSCTETDAEPAAEPAADSVPAVPAATDYTIHACKEEVLKFDNLNFKLAVVNELMYRQKLISPCFKLEDFIRWYKGGPIDAASSESIKPALNYFRRLPVAAALASSVTEIRMEPGNEIYQNICPQWKGCDDRFDVNSISAKELAQFTQLKNVSLMSNRSDVLYKKLEKAGIHTESL